MPSPDPATTPDPEVTPDPGTETARAASDPDPGTAADAPRTAGDVRRENLVSIRRALVLAILAGVLIDAVVIVLAALIGSPAALPGALIGTGLALVVTVPTLLSERLSRGREPMIGAAVLMGAWLVKMFVLVIVIALVQDVTSISKPWIGIALLAGALVAAVTEALALLAKKPRLEVDSPSVES